MSRISTSLRTLVIVATAFGLSACDVAYPVAAIGENGMIFRGTASNTFLEGGSFHATNGKSACVGRYTQAQDMQQASFPVNCNNGLTGIGTAVFETATSGSGQVLMSDGSKWRFLFGRQAARI